MTRTVKAVKAVSLLIPFAVFYALFPKFAIHTLGVFAAGLAIVLLLFIVMAVSGLLCMYLEYTVKSLLRIFVDID